MYSAKKKARRFFTTYTVASILMCSVNPLMSLQAASANPVPAGTTTTTTSTAASTKPGDSSTNNLTVASGNTLIVDFGSGNHLNLTGNLTNSGTIYAFSSVAGVTSGVINSELSLS